MESIKQTERYALVFARDTCLLIFLVVCKPIIDGSSFYIVISIASHK